MTYLPVVSDPAFKPKKRAVTKKYMIFGATKGARSVKSPAPKVTRKRMKQMEEGNLGTRMNPAVKDEKSLLCSLFGMTLTSCFARVHITKTPKL